MADNQNFFFYADQKGKITLITPRSNKKSAGLFSSISVNLEVHVLARFISFLISCFVTSTERKLSIEVHFNKL